MHCSTATQQLNPKNTCSRASVRFRYDEPYFPALFRSTEPIFRKARVQEIRSENVDHIFFIGYSLRYQAIFYDTILRGQRA